MSGFLVILGLGVLVAILAVKVFHNVVRRLAPVLCPFWFWFSGRSMDGRDYAGKTRWQRLPRPHRASYRTGGTLAATGVTWGLLAATVATIVCLCCLAGLVLAAGIWHGTYRARRWRHERHHVRPLEARLTRSIGTAPESIEVRTRRDEESGVDVITGVVIDWPPAAEIGPPEKDLALEAVTTRLAIEAPEPQWELKGRARRVTFTPSEPPPSYVPWEDMAAAVKAAAFNELVFGVGRRNTIVTAAYSESPHLCIPGGSGGGKSNLAAFLLLQEMMRGTLIVNLDPKWISHLWLQGLPNVISAHDIPDLHEALVWLGRELLRRTKAAYYSANGTGRVRGSVGARVIVLAEELNYGMPGLKDYWREIRAKEQPKQSPAISALSALSCAGRASDMHEYLIAQMLTVASTGVSDSTIRTNAGIKAMARHDPPGWAMAVGKHVPMPAPSTIPGRIQLVTGDGVRETQVPYLHLDDKDAEVADKAVTWARELAVSGTVAKIPIGGEYGVPEQLLPPCVADQVLSSQTPPEQRLSTETSPIVQGVPPDAMTLSDAVARGIIGPSIHAVRKARERGGGFPEPVGERGSALLYSVRDLYAWSRDRGKKAIR